MKIAFTEIGPLLEQLERGKFVGVIDEKLAELGREMAEGGGKGKMTITLSFDTEKGRSATTTITGDVSIRKPSRKPKPMVRFLTPEGGFVSEDPDQPELPGVAENVTPLLTAGEAEAPAPESRRVKVK